MIEIPSYSTDDALQTLAVGPDGYIYIGGDEEWKSLCKVDDIPRVKALERQLAEKDNRLVYAEGRLEEVIAERDESNRRIAVFQEEEETFIGLVNSQNDELGTLRSDLARVTDELEAVRGEVKANNDACLWDQAEEGSNWYDTSCGHTFILNDGSPVENDLKYCCYCGLELEQGLWVIEEAEEDTPPPQAEGVGDE